MRGWVLFVGATTLEDVADYVRGHAELGGDLLRRGEGGRPLADGGHLLVSELALAAPWPHPIGSRAVLAVVQVAAAKTAPPLGAPFDDARHLAPLEWTGHSLAAAGHDGASSVAIPCHLREHSKEQRSTGYVSDFQMANICHGHRDSRLPHWAHTRRPLTLRLGSHSHLAARMGQP